MREISSISGDIAELGIWKGNNSVLFARFTKMFNIPRTIHCFDNFSGLPEPSKFDVVDYPEGKYKGLRSVFEATLELHSLFDLVRIHEGLIEDTVPRFLEERSEHSLKFAMIYFDADLYSPATTMFRYLAQLVSVGGVILLDEYGFAEWPGETKATDDFLAVNPEFILELTPEYVHQPSAVIRRVA